MSIGSQQRRRQRLNTPTATAKGTYLLAVDRLTVVTRMRHTSAESVKTECKRLAHNLGERVLVLKVVGVLDRRAGASDDASE